VRIDAQADGRHVITGLLIGEEFGAPEITSVTLRRVRLAEILAAVFADFDPDDTARWGPAESVLTAAVVNARAGARVASAGGRRGPDDQALRDFARTYQIELARQPRRAMSAAAKAHSISIATAHRWAAECRERGYLPGS
jgi:hypothetical protein